MKFVVVLATGSALFAAPFVGTVEVHNWQLSQLQNRIGALTHPSGSSFMARHGKIDNFGNGNHLDFWAVELRSSTSRAAVQKAYRGVRVRVPNSNDDAFSDVKNGTQPIEIAFLPSPLPANYRVKVGDNTQWNLKQFAGKRGLYTIEVVNPGENDNLATLFDWRGN